MILTPVAVTKDNVKTRSSRTGSGRPSRSARGSTRRPARRRESSKGISEHRGRAARCHRVPSDRTRMSDNGPGTAAPALRGSHASASGAVQALDGRGLRGQRRRGRRPRRRQRRRQVHAGQGHLRHPRHRTSGEFCFDGQPVTLGAARRDATRARDRDRLPGPGAVRQPRRRRPTCSSGRRCAARLGAVTRRLDETKMEQRSHELLDQLAVTHPERALGGGRALRRPAPAGRGRALAAGRAEGRAARRADRGAGRRPDRAGARR